MAQGWRRFGHSTFHPICTACRACQPIRVVVERFVPNRSQRRAWRANEGIVTLRIGAPSVTEDKLALHYRYHAFQAGFKDWPAAHRREADEYHESFVANPFPTEEWSYYVGHDLVGVGYVDVLPASLSAIYFFYEPDERWRSLGTYNVLNVVDQARQRRLPHVYLGYYVAGCRSMEYKATFRPNEVLGPDGQWRTHRT
jgi:arginine-tRNA-protein transferase